MPFCDEVIFVLKAELDGEFVDDCLLRETSVETSGGQNEVYHLFFAARRVLGRTGAGVTALAYDARIEIDLIARRP
jgi:enamine deaminase RidA (YjgF/YER057c/UK114 family)